MYVNMTLSESEWLSSKWNGWFESWLCYFVFYFQGETTGFKVIYIVSKFNVN